MKYLGTGPAADWLALAHSDLDAAALLADGQPHLACYHAEQAVEKALKALYVARSVYFPFVHALGQLIDGLVEAYPELEELRVAATTLTLYEVHTRYIQLGTGLNPLKEFKSAHAGQALDDARRIVAACDQIYGTLVHAERSAPAPTDE